MPNNSVDVALSEFTALRAEILQCQQMQTFTFTAALAADSAVAAFAFAEAGNQPILLVLPLLLGGLCLLYLGYLRRPLVLGRYIRDHLWPTLRKQTDYDGLPCWEESLSARPRSAIGRRTPFICPPRDEHASWHSKQRLLSAAPGFLVFIVPSLAVLITAPWLLIRNWNVWYLGPWALGLLIVLLCAAEYYRGPSSWRPELV